MLTRAHRLLVASLATRIVSSSTEQVACRRDGRRPNSSLGVEEGLPRREPALEEAMTARPVAE
eukprot:SAG22_NODE_13513_length_404_cov_0.557377_1_plen_62_part_01